MNRAATFALAPASSLYRAIINRRNALYRRGVFREHLVGAAVISVGNLTMGGTGKTPLVAWIAAKLAANNRRVCVLTRGYGRKTNERVVVSDGREILAGVDEAGDEALLLAEQLKGQAAVICDANRVEAARWAVENLRSDVFILDDGFQHRRMARDLDVVVVDATNPWGNGSLLPAGTLREPISELARADCIMITRAEDANDIDSLRNQITGLNKAAPVFLARMNLAKTRELNENATPGTDLKTMTIGAFCAVGNPGSFFSLLARAGLQLTYRRAFRDHHKYTQSDVDSIEREARTRGVEVLLTTAKDAVKLRSLKFDFGCFVAEISVEIEPEAEFWNLILKAEDTNRRTAYEF